jgi:hypothetical protein
MKVVVEVNIKKDGELTKKEYMFYVLICLIAKFLKLDKDVKQINL